MSRSRRKTPIFGWTTATSEKVCKRDANRKFRRVTKQQVYLRHEVPSAKRELSNVWAMAKDGKTYQPDMADKYMRK